MPKVNVFEGCEGCYYNRIRLREPNFKCYTFYELHLTCPCKECLVKTMCRTHCDKIRIDPVKLIGYYNET